MTDETVTLFRPTGPEELQLVRESGFRAWPPRLPDQPIFYPVTNEEYVAQVARDWNVRASGCGYVMRFPWWIPADDLEELNSNLVGVLEVTQEFLPR